MGYVEIDLVVHYGSSTFGEYANTLSVTEASSRWWEGEAITGKSQVCLLGFEQIRKRARFDWKGIDSDNGSEFINQISYKYCQRERREFIRSRENKK